MATRRTVMGFGVINGLRTWTSLPFLLMAICFAATPCTRAHSAEVDAKLERQLLAIDQIPQATPTGEDDPALPRTWRSAWEKVIDQCGTDEQVRNDPVLRAIKGHACLAVNRNKESLGLLLSIGGEEGKQRWQEWAASFAERNPSSAMALYFSGDASARVGEWGRAERAYDLAIEDFRERSPQPAVLALVYNARGVLHGVHGARDVSKADLQQACRLTPWLADAWASLGTLKLQHRATKGALKDYVRALDLSPDFALAENGRACALLHGGNEAQAEAAFEHCLDDQAVRLLAAGNLTATLSQKAESLRSIVEAVRAPGTSVVTRDDRYVQQMRTNLKTMSPSEMKGYLEQQIKTQGYNPTRDRLNQAVRSNSDEAKLDIATAQQNFGNAYTHDIKQGIWGGAGKGLQQSSYAMGLAALADIEPATKTGLAGGAILAGAAAIDAQTIANNHRTLANSQRTEGYGTLQRVREANSNANSAQRALGELHTYTYRMDVTGNVNQDRVTAEQMGRQGGTIRANGGLQKMNTAYVVHPDGRGDLADATARGARTQGFQEIRVVPESQFTGSRLNSNTDVVYRIEGLAAGREGGVSVDLSPGSFRKKNWGVGTWFGLAQVTPPPSALAKTE